MDSQAHHLATFFTALGILLTLGGMTAAIIILADTDPTATSPNHALAPAAIIGGSCVTVGLLLLLAGFSLHLLAQITDNTATTAKAAQL